MVYRRYPEMFRPGLPALVEQSLQVLDLDGYAHSKDNDRLAKQEKGEP